MTVLEDPSKYRTKYISFVFLTVERERETETELESYTTTITASAWHIPYRASCKE